MGIIPATPWGKRIAVLATSFTATLGAVVAMANALNVAEPYWIATRGFVKDQIQRTGDQMASVHGRQIDTQIRIDRNERARVLDKIADRELLLQQNPDMPAQARAAIDEQIRNWRDDIRELDYSLDQLHRSRAGRRP
jgi:pyocin large subunit-like protein